MAVKKLLTSYFGSWWGSPLAFLLWLAVLAVLANTVRARGVAIPTCVVLLLIWVSILAAAIYQFAVGARARALRTSLCFVGATVVLLVGAYLVYTLASMIAE